MYGQRHELTPAALDRLMRMTGEIRPEVVVDPSKKFTNPTVWKTSEHHPRMVPFKWMTPDGRSV